MAKFVITGPDGAKYQINAPDDATEEQVLAYAQSQFKKPEQTKEKFDPTEGMSGTDKFLAGMGKAFTDIGRGGGQMLRDALPQGAADALGLPTGSDIEETRRLDRALMNTGAGTAGNIAGALVPALATAALPGANTITGAAAGGALMGALQPVTGDESRLFNVGLGGAFGAAGQGVAKGIGRVINPIRNAQNAEVSRLAQVAASEGIPLDAAAVTGSKPLQAVNAVMENLPFTAGKEAAKGQARQQAFNAAVLKRAGINANNAAPEVLAAQKQALGKTFEDIAGRNAINFTGLNSQLDDIVNQASRRLPPDRAGAIANTVEDMRSQLQDGILAGTNYQGWRTELGRMARGNDAEAHYFSQLKKALDKAFSAQVSGADAAAWRQASSQYGNLKTIMNAMGGAGANPATGNIAPAQLNQAFTSAMSREGKALGRGELNDLVRVGQTFVRDQVPNSGTAQRLLYQSLLTGGLGLGGGIAAGADPVDALKYGAYGLAAPKLAQMLLNSPHGQRYLINGVQDPRLLALARTLQAGSTPLGMAVPQLLNAAE